MATNLSQNVGVGEQGMVCAVQEDVVEGEDRPRCAGKQGTNKSNASRGHASAPVRPSVIASWSLCRNSWDCKADRRELLYVYALPGGLAMTKEYILTFVRADVVVPI